jgi:hypothetical protein
VHTSPLTGGKGLFSAAHEVEHGWIDGVTSRESDIIKQYFLQLFLGIRLAS